MADHIHGRISGRLTMIMGGINMKIWFLILAAVVLSGCESPQVTRQIAQGQIIAQGFSDAGDTITNSARPAPSVYVQQPAPVFQPVQIPQAAPPSQIDTPRYQMFNGASPGQIRY